MSTHYKKTTTLRGSRMSKISSSESVDRRRVSRKKSLPLPIPDTSLPRQTENCTRVPSFNSTPEMDPRTIRWKYDYSATSDSQTQTCSRSESSEKSISSYERDRHNYSRTNEYSCDSSFEDYGMNFGYSVIPSNQMSTCNHLLVTTWNQDFILLQLWRAILRLTGRCLSRRFLTGGSHWIISSSFLYIFVALTACLFIHATDGCSSRSTPKPRPPSPTLRPNITIQTYTCPPEYDAHYCLNGASCFTVKIGDSILYNCECAEGYMGQRCEFKDLEGSYLPSKQRAMLEQAGITSGVVVMIILVVIICSYLYIRSRRKPLKIDNEIKCDPVENSDTVDNMGQTYGLVLPKRSKEKRPFSDKITRDC